MLLRRLACALAALLAVAGGPAAVAQPIGSVLFVDADATGTADGSSWADAFPDLQQALAVAAAGDEVWVAEGTYLPAEGGVVDRDASFVLVSGTALYGGFDGTEGARDERDPEVNVTILSGDLGVPDDLSDNAYHVVVASGVDESTVLDGFTVTGGNGNGASPRNRGGGIYAENSSLVVRDCRIIENRVVQTDGEGGGGGAFFGSGGTPRFERVAFERNDGALGGGLWLFEGVDAVVVDAAFVENTADSGGGINSNQSTLTVVGTSFVRNVADRGGGGISVLIGSTHLLNAGFYGNVAEPGGAFGLSLGAGVNSSGPLTATNVTFVGNMAEKAAGLSAGGNDGYLLTNVTFAANEALVEGGAVRISSGSDLLLRNSVLWGNGDEIAEVAGTSTLRHVLVAGGCPPEATCEALLDADPRFVRVPDPGPDGAWGTADDDYGDLRLRDDSPAIDFGLTSFLPSDAFDLDGDGNTAEPLPLDLAGEARVVGASVDLGAYERPAPVAAESELAGPDAVTLGAYPNPARGPVSVSLALGRSQRVEVTVYDVLGRRVARLHDGPLAAGHHALAFDASRLGAGLYLIRAIGDGFSAAQRVTTVR
ncbi:MAG: right-handed parallel beta-helix repeat-containing protein [Rhodothermales bacterium]